MPRHHLLAAALAIAAGRAGAQDAGPLALLLPVSARSAALGNAWVAGRDEYAVFSNPALASATNGFGFTVAGYGSHSRALAAAAGATVGPATLAWGVHLVDFSFPRSVATYPYSPGALARSGDADLFSMVALAAGRIVWKNFNIGVAGKYAQDLAPTEASTTSLLVVPTRASTALLDVGTSHALWTGVAGLSVQNIAPPYRFGGRLTDVPSQVSLGWTKLQQVGPLDVGYAVQGTMRRHGWVGVGGGLDVSWSWIEGYTVGGRIGARRTETDEERPMALGATFNADRLNVEYAIGMFTDARQSHRVTVRWR
jgi:hypothetical protein